MNKLYSKLYAKHFVIYANFNYIINRYLKILCFIWLILNAIYSYNIAERRAKSLTILDKSVKMLYNIRL